MRDFAAFLLGVGASVLLATGGCHNERGAAPVAADPPPDGIDAGGSRDEDGGLAFADRVHVTGLVATESGDPVGGRAVVLVGADGARRALVTAGDGSFDLDAVAVPYDLAVAGSPPAVFLGVERLAATFEIGEPSGPSAAPPSQTVRVGIRSPSCPALRPTCSVTVVTASQLGDGLVRAPCGESLAPTIVSVPHAWRASPGVGEAIAVHALIRCDGAGGSDGPLDDERRSGDAGVSGAADGAYAYGRLDGVPASPESITDAGMMDTALIASTAPVTFGARGDAQELAPWIWTTAVKLDVAGARDRVAGQETGFVLATTQDPAATLRLPSIRGAAVRVEVRAEHPRNDPSGGFFRAAEAWSGAMPVITATPPALLGVDLVAGPDLLAPETGTPLQAGKDISWQGTGSGLAILSVASASRSVQCFRVSTEDEQLSVERLAALGVPRLEPGPHVLALTTYPGSSLADATSPDPALRRRRLDRTQRGAATYLRAPFDVAP